MKRKMSTILSFVLLLTLLLSQSVSAQELTLNETNTYKPMTDGRSEIRDGKLYVPGGGEVNYCSKKSFEGDFTVEMRASVDVQAVGIKLGANKQAQDPLWCLSAVAPYGVRIHQANNWANPNHIPLDEVKLGQMVTLRIEIKGSQVTTYLNDKKIDICQMQPQFTSGHLGLRFAQIEQGEIDYIRVTQNDETIWEDDFEYMDGDKWTFPLPQRWNEEIMTPVWQGNTMYRESVWVVANADGSIDDIPLLYPADRILSVQNSRQNKTYTEGADYTLADGKLRIPAGSSVPITTYSTYYGSGSPWPSSDGGYIYYPGEDANGTDQQICITYEHSGSWNGTIPENKSDQLPKFTEKLKNGGQVTIVYNGDSITAGANSSGLANVEPFMSRYSGLVTGALIHEYPNAEISEINTAVGGMDAVWGLANVETNINAYHPDLVLIAFGMNDAGRPRTVEQYSSDIKGMMDAVKAKNPDCEFVLVTTSMPNPKGSTIQGNHAAYGPALKAMEGEGVVVADMTTMHKDLMAKKDYRHMTGNNVNHPNDFLQRVYAQVVFETISGYQVRTDKTQLEEIIVEAKKVIGDGTTDRLSEEDKQLFMDAYNKALDIYENSNDQDEVDDILHTLTAQVETIGERLQYAVKYIAEAVGSIVGKAEQKIISRGSTESVTAKPDSGFVFVKWDDGNTSATRFDTNISEDHTFSAIFNKVPDQNQPQEPEPVVTVDQVNGVRASNNKTNSLKLSWDKVSGAAGYEVQSYNAKTRQWSDVTTVTTNSYTVKKLTAATSYSYRIRAYKNSGKTIVLGDYSASFKTATAPSKSKLTAKTLKKNQVRLTWKKIKGASGYEVQMKKGAGSYKKIKTISNGKTVKYLRKNLKKGTYRFRVRGYVKAGSKKIYGSYSNSRIIKIKKS